VHHVELWSVGGECIRHELEPVHVSPGAVVLARCGVWNSEGPRRPRTDL
jgi:hypothetical protein